MEKKERELKPLLVSVKDLAKVLGVSQCHIRNMVKEGKFPKPFPMGYKLLRWRMKDVEEWIDKMG